MTFSFESESNSKMPFLDAQVSEENGRFKIHFHRKSTFSSVYTHFDSLQPTQLYINLVKSITWRLYSFKFALTGNFFMMNYRN